MKKSYIYYSSSIGNIDNRVNMPNLKNARMNNI